MKKIFAAIFFSIMLVSNIAFAEISMVPPTPDIEVTSPFGWRTHPIFGDSRYHSGIDLGIWDNDPIKAAAGGTVSYAGWIDGYGYTVIIEHGEGIESLYAHNNQVLVTEGQNVAQSQLIAMGGSTGNSTGPHCHFEVKQDGECIDPGLFNFSLKVAEEDCRAGGQGLGGDGGTYYGQLPSGADEAFEGGAVSLVINADFAKPIRDTVELMINTITKALTFLREGITEIFIVLITCDLVIGILKQFLTKTEDQKENMLTIWIIQRVMFYCIILFFMQNWGEIIANLAMHGLPELGAIAMGSNGEAAASILSDPTQIVQRGIQIITPLINQILTPQSIADIFLGPVFLVTMVFGAVFFILFTIIGVMLAKTYIEFYLTLLFSFTTFMFSGLQRTRQIASNGLNGIFAASINLMFFCMFAIMLQSVMENIAVDSLTTVNRIEQTADNIQNNKIANKDDLMARIRLLESYNGNYHCDKGTGGYGAYQINKGVWDKLCDEYSNDKNNRYQLDTDNDYERYSDNGAYNSHPEPSSKYPWSPRNQDIIMSYILQKNYNGDWNITAIQFKESYGSGNSNDYLEQLLAIRGQHSLAKVPTVNKAINFTILFKLLLVCLIFIFMGDRVQKLILKQFGGMGFRLTNGE